MHPLLRLSLVLSLFAATHSAFAQSDIKYCDGKITAVSGRSQKELLTASGQDTMFFVTFKNTDSSNLKVVVTGSQYLDPDHDPARVPGELVLAKGEQKEFPALRVFVHEKARHLGPDAIMGKLIVSCSAS
jgi:hypothetical protein